MNKNLLLGSALLVAISAYPQNGKLIKPSGTPQLKIKNTNIIEGTGTSDFKIAKPVKNIEHNSIGNTNKVSVISATRFTGSMNVFSYLVSNSKPLTHNPSLNSVTFIHRKSPTYVVSSNGNSGSIVAMVSSNAGMTWDSTAIWANTASLARYPQGGLYNPLGNTNIANAYVVGMGPITPVSGGWAGNWYASKSLSGGGNNTPGVDQQAILNASTSLKKHQFSRYSFSSIDGGLVRSMASVMNDPDNSPFGYRGGAMVKGQFTAGSFVWSVDSFIPATTINGSNGQKNIAGDAMQAWSNDGMTGYVVIIGSRATETISATRVNSKGGYQPIVYKTTNAGATWGMMPANDFSDYAKYRGVNDRMYPVVSNTALLVPNFINNEGEDVTVDINGNLHLVQNLVGGYSNHVDSLGYSYGFTIGGEQYSYGSGNFNWPIIYDFYTNSAGGWDYHMIDSMYSEGPSIVGYPGASSNPWLNGSDKVGYDARIQVARTADGRKMIYSWSESDTSLLGTKWNVYPDIKMKGFDVTTNMVTGRVNVTQGITGVDQNSYFHYMCDKAIGSSTACIEMPFVAITSDNSNDGLQPVVDYYIAGAQLCPADFNTTALAPTGIVAATKNTVSFDVINYPNPANGATTILVSLTEAKAFDVAIYNAVGQLVDTYKMNGHKGANEIHIDLNNFSSGVYVYNVKVGNTSVTKKLIVQ